MEELLSQTKSSLEAIKTCICFISIRSPTSGKQAYYCSEQDGRESIHTKSSKQREQHNFYAK